MSPVNANALLPLNGWYPQGVTALAGGGLNPNNYSWFNSPYVTNLVLNYRHAKFAITPSMQIQAGAQYGSPYDVVGEDPRNCAENQGTSGVVAAGSATALNCDFTQETNVGSAPVYGYLYVPNPQTGKFATPGGFNEPTIAMLNLQLSLRRIAEGHAATHRLRPVAHVLRRFERTVDNRIPDEPIQLRVSGKQQLREQLLQRCKPNHGKRQLRSSRVSLGTTELSSEVQQQRRRIFPV